MFLLGLLAIVQIVFLPGYLLLRLIRLRMGFFGALISSFALSLIFNHFLVWFLVVAGLYRSGIIYGLFSVEIVLFILLVRNSAHVTLADLFQRMVDNLRIVSADYFPQNLDDKLGLSRTTVFLAAAGLIIGYCIYELVPLDRIFCEWDAVVSWNRWACEWAANQMPQKTAEYPQLLPTNLSLTYVFTQSTSIWFFAKAIMFLFCLGILLAIFDLGLKTKRIGYLLGVIFTYLLFNAILRARNLSNGYADVPAAFFAFSTVYVLLRARLGVPDAFKHLFLAALLAAGAALTKQAGLFAAVAFPLWSWSLSGKGDSDATYRIRVKQVVYATLCMIAIIAPWYLYKQLNIRHGGDASNTMYLIQTIHAGRSVLQRFFHAWTLLSEMLSLPGLIFLIVTLAGAWRDYVGRRMVCFIVVPYALIWCFAFSYDNRNIALAIPFAGVAAGIGAIEILGMLERRFALHGASLMGWIPNLLSARLGSAVIVLLVILAALGNRISSEELVARQLDLQKQVGVRETNEQLYAYEHDHGFASDIASDYYCLGWLPQLNRHYRLCSSLDLPSFLAVYERPEVGYALMHKTSAAAAVQDYIERAGSEGKLRLVFDTRYYRLYEKLGMR